MADLDAIDSVLTSLCAEKASHEARGDVGSAADARAWIDVFLDRRLEAM